MLQAPFSHLFRRAPKTINTVVAKSSAYLPSRQFLIKTDSLKSVSIPSFSTTPFRALKEIVETVEGGETVVEGVKLQLPRGNLVKIQDVDGSLRSLFDDREFWGLLSHTDVLILRQFLNTDYTVLPIEVTGLKPYQQERIEHLVRKAQRANLIPLKVKELRDTVPFSSELKYGDYDHTKYNSYYDDWDKLY